MNSAPSSQLYDTTGLAAALSAAINQCGSVLTDAGRVGKASRQACIEAVEAEASKLRHCREECQRWVDHVWRNTSGWAPSESLSVALADADHFIGLLADFEADLARFGGSDHEQCAAMLCILGLNMFRRDHAFRTHSRGSENMRHPPHFSADTRLYADALNKADSNVIEFCAARRRKPPTETFCQLAEGGPGADNNGPSSA